MIIQVVPFRGSALKSTSQCVEVMAKLIQATVIY